MGLTHLSVKVDDLDAVAAKIRMFGGSVVENTRTTIMMGDATVEFVYCTDPDGVRIELMGLGDR